MIYETIREQEREEEKNGERIRASTLGLLELCAAEDAAANRRATTKIVQ